MRFRDNALFINTVLLGGSTEEKIRAAADAGFSQIEIWRQDIDAAGGNPAEIVRQLQHHNLNLTDYQVLLDFTGAPEEMQKQKREEALAMLDTAVALGATTLLTPASTHQGCIAERETDDLYWLVREANKRDLRVAFEAMAWSTHINTTDAAWRCVAHINEPNLGLVVDAFHIFVRNRTLADLAGIPMDKIFLVQLSDLQALPESGEVKETARHHRLLPGEGNFPLHTLLDYLETSRYSGPVGLEVFSDTLSQKPPREVAGEAMQALKKCLCRIN
ncbi:MAG TPA: sugar phosphate isomerase/epimerase family protein [Enterobacteriaceae bacterium]|nr:sugar phosphate isomerase/epimerase family protein [Enterobacteriaceae bacterium]